MAIPSFESILNEARNQSQRKADLQNSERTNNLIGSQVSNFVNTLGNTPIGGPPSTVVGEINPANQQYTSFATPQQQGLTGFQRMFGMQPYQPQNPGSLPVSSSDLGKVIPELFKPNVPVNVLNPQGQSIGTAAKGSILTKSEPAGKPDKTLLTKSEFLKRNKAGEKLSANDFQIVDDSQSPGNKPLSSQAALNIENANSGIRAIDRMMETLTKRPEIYRKAGAPGISGLLSVGDPASQKYKNDLNEATDVITRLRTGAALNAEEQKFYSGQLSSILNSPDVAKNNLLKVRDFYKGIIDRITSGTRSDTPTEGSIAPPMSRSGKTKSGLSYTIE